MQVYFFLNSRFDLLIWSIKLNMEFELKQGIILRYNPFPKWVQYVSNGDTKGCVIYDGENQTYASTNDLSPLDLPIGLIALGFVEMKNEISNLPFPVVYRNGKMEIFRDKSGQFFIDNKQIKFTHQVQEFFDLFEMLPNKLLRSIPK